MKSALPLKHKTGVDGNVLPFNTKLVSMKMSHSLNAENPVSMEMSRSSTQNWCRWKCLAPQPQKLVSMENVRPHKTGVDGNVSAFQRKLVSMKCLAQHKTGVDGMPRSSTQTWCRWKCSSFNKTGVDVEMSRPSRHFHRRQFCVEERDIYIDTSFVKIR
ncbi:hypothetical protein AVEN_113964-1 [Araneus ventricosus]|uniref:Uncharacterized protein n=1 Tax=Araneus ventricosus TaxID=182803 RepID=A0A4Y2RWC1_ARAVE|nr:hypothetical protein AVEN_113964-1 [Araneus ventricosus]